MDGEAERGFTLPELLIVIIVLVGLLAGSMFLLRPKSYASSDNDANRRLGIALLAQSFRDYKLRFGAWPAGVPANDTPISTDGYNACQYIVPLFIKDMPFDPELGLEYTGDANAPTPTSQSCDKTGVKYTTGYSIRQDSDGITFSATASNLTKLTISIR